MKKIALFALTVLVLTTIAIAGCVDVGEISPIPGMDTVNGPYTVTTEFSAKSGDVLMNVTISGPPKDLFVFLQFNDKTVTEQKVLSVKLEDGVETLSFRAIGYSSGAGYYKVTIRETDLTEFDPDKEGKVLYRKTVSFDGPELSITGASLRMSTQSKSRAFVDFTFRNDGDSPAIIFKAKMLLDGKESTCTFNTWEIILPHSTKVVDLITEPPSSKVVSVQFYTNSEVPCEYKGVLK